MKKVKIVSFDVYGNREKTEKILEDLVNEGWKITIGGGFDNYARSYVILVKE